jgi:fructose/tagatose bisphosphate aldolase
MEEWSGYAFDAKLAYQYCSKLVKNGAEHLTPPVKAHRDHCSAFVATGRYTTDGKPVMYHNSFNVFETSGYANVIVTITPEKTFAVTRARGVCVCRIWWRSTVIKAKSFLLVSRKFLG